MKYTDILKENTHLGESLSSEKYTIRVLSNIVVNQLGEILEYFLRDNAIPAVVSFGDYDNIVQDSFNVSNENLVIVFWELSNLIDGLHYRAEIFSDEEIKELERKVLAEIELVFESLKSLPLVLFNRFSTLLFCHNTIIQGQLETLARRLNGRLETMVSKNIHLIDIDKVIATVGVQNSVDFRYFYSSKVLYTVVFFQAYARKIQPYIMAANGLMKKAIIFDCDNTLWKGIIAEDGFENIELSRIERVGAIFSEIQSLALSLQRNQGVLLGLCSKNNLADVNKVLDEHPDMLIRNNDLSIKIINWKDKASNLKEISNELNIGLESIVFIDDSDFEVELVKNELPEVTVLKVPSKIHEYPKMIRDNFGLFFGFSMTEEDRSKTTMYQQQAERALEEKKIGNINDYLSSLGITVKVHIDDYSSVSRMAQITQKTNQFNLTTKRYTEAEILKFVSDETVKVISIAVSDKFGDSGVTGLCVFKILPSENIAEIDTLLMSCRIIGRNIEYAFMDVIAEFAMKENVSKVFATYKKTEKNEQVCDFYDRCGLDRVEADSDIDRYVLNVKDYKQKKIEYIEVRNG